MNLTDALLGEHAVFYAQFDEIERSLLEDDLASLKRRGSLLAAALESHAHLENDLLFEPLRARAGDEGIFVAMLEEHEAIEAALHELAATRDLERARDLALEVVHLARQHFAKEENVAFPMADRLLEKAEQEKLIARWARARTVVLPEEY